MSRYYAYYGSIILAVLSFLLLILFPRWSFAISTLIFSALSILGTLDVFQNHSALRKNYPVLAHFRYFLESIGPEIRQYFIQTDTENTPFSRQQRALIYQRAKGVMDVVPFGTLQSAYAVDYEWINHSMQPAEIPNHDFRITIGKESKQPYSASVFNISAMSFGALSANAIRALNGGAKEGNFYHDTGEGSISPYHKENGGDLVWEIGSGYFGCRDEKGNFDPEKFKINAHLEQVKMIEIKLSQGAKPGHGGVLPAAKVSAEISQTRGVPMGQDCVSPSRHTAFSNPIELLEFVAKLRDLSGGKPTGFKLAIGHPWEWFGIAKAMLETNILPDFIVVDGAEGGTGAAPSEFIDHVGVPMNEGLLLVHNTLIGLNLRHRISIGAAGKIVNAFDLARTMALGADWCNSGRGFMFALGCIQSLSCHTDRCPTGVATQNPERWKNLQVPDKRSRVNHYHASTLKALRDLLAAAGLEHPSELGPEHILRRVSATEIRSLSSLFRYLKPGDLLNEKYDHAVFKYYWEEARTDSFSPPNHVKEKRSSRNS